MEVIPLRFIEEPVETLFEKTPAISKNPPCPQGFIWGGETYLVGEVLSEWRDYQRRGRMARNMSSEHSDIASRRGSWGVGQIFFRVRTKQGRIFDLYYDRAPKNVDQRQGGWFLYQELVPLDRPDNSMGS